MVIPEQEYASILSLFLTIYFQVKVAGKRPKIEILEEKWTWNKIPFKKNNQIRFPPFKLKKNQKKIKNQTQVALCVNYIYSNTLEKSVSQTSEILIRILGLADSSVLLWSSVSAWVFRNFYFVWFLNGYLIQ